VTLSNGRRTVEWTSNNKLAWVPVETSLQLHSGNYFIEFYVEEMASYQIGVGFLLDWNIGPDWGFFGYLGSSSSAWSYDPSTGDIVYNTRSIAGRLPKFKENKGTIAIKFSLPEDGNCTAQFIVDKLELDPIIDLPKEAVVIPAVCLLRKLQKVTLTKCIKLNQDSF